MKNRAWNRSERITQVRDRIWTYLSPASRSEAPDLLVAGALLQWPEAEAARLGELQFLLCGEVGNFLGSLPQLMRKLATSSAREEEQTDQQLRGPVEWSRTLALRRTTATPNLYITAPARRVYQTAENELLVHVLDAIVRTAHGTGWDRITPRQEPAQRLNHRLSVATGWKQNRMLSGIERTPPSSRSVARIRSGRNAQRYSGVLAAYDKLVALVEQVDRQAVREAVEDAGLVTAQESTLFELIVTFQIMDALTTAGWEMARFTLLTGRVHADGHSPDGRQIDLWYQCTPRDLTATSQYRRVLTEHGFTRQPGLRPDVTLRWTDRHGKQRWLLIECKLSQRGGVGAAARQALVDLLAYSSDFDAVLRTTSGPHGLGIAWGEGLLPNVGSEIVLCTPDAIAQAIYQILT